MTVKSKFGKSEYLEPYLSVKSVENIVLIGTAVSDM